MVIIILFFILGMQRFRVVYCGISFKLESASILSMHTSLKASVEVPRKESINLTIKEEECDYDSFACARHPVRQTGFPLYK